MFKLPIQKTNESPTANYKHETFKTKSQKPVGIYIVGFEYYYCEL